MNLTSSSFENDFEDSIMEQSFFFAPHDDNNIYHVQYKEILVTEVSETNLVQLNTKNRYVFYHQQTDSKKSYKVTCEIVSHQSIVRFLNKSIHNIEFKQNDQSREYLNFTHEKRSNLELHLKNFLFDNLTHKTPSNLKKINKKPQKSLL